MLIDLDVMYAADIIFMEVFRAVYFNLLTRKYVENNVFFFKNKESLSL